MASLDQRDAVTSAASGLGIPLQAIELHSPPYDYEQALAGTDGARGDPTGSPLRIMVSGSRSDELSAPPPTKSTYPLLHLE